MDNKVWILGPCAMESEDVFIQTAESINKMMPNDTDWYMKASFDKANRTSLHGKRGIGLDEAIKVWRKAKKIFPNMQFITDVHECWQVEKLSEVIDVIQIPAFLCRQTDLIVESAKYFNKINIKKGQWLGPNNLIKSINKIKETNPNCEAWICDRGTNFGYNDLFVNFGIVDKLKQHYDKVILDCTHSIQRSRAVYGTQGDRNLAERYFVAADVFGYDGVFAEVHPNPPEAISDADCQIYLHRIKMLLEMANSIGQSSRGLHENK